MHRLASRGLAGDRRRLARGSTGAAPRTRDQDGLEQELVLIGFLGLEDPVRAEVPDGGGAAATRPGSRW